MNKPPTLPPPSLPAKQDRFLTVRCNRPDALAKFIADLKEAASASKDSGGTYAAFLILSDGRKLQVEIAYPGRI